MRISVFLLFFTLLYSTESFGQDLNPNHSFPINQFRLNSGNTLDFNTRSKEISTFKLKECTFLFQDTLPTFARFAYSNLVMLSSSIAGHAYLILRTYKEEDWLHKYSWSSVERTFTLPPKWDEDHWSFNYMVHPYMGALTYLAWRNRGGSWWSASLVSAINSAMYEYLVASSIQRPSANDLIITPITGAILGEAIFIIEHKILKNKDLSLAEKIILTIIDPYEVARHRFIYENMN